MNSKGKGDDIFQLCGGAGRESILAARRRLVSGGNFDLVTGVDLNQPYQQQAVLHYIDTNDPKVALMALRCTAFGPWSSYNKIHYPEGWQRSYVESWPHARFGGEVAGAMMDRGRDWLSEQPQGSQLYKDPPWPSVLALSLIHI